MGIVTDNVYDIIVNPIPMADAPPTYFFSSDGKKLKINKKLSKNAGKNF